MKIVERTTVHISDDTGRIAMLENRTYGTAANDNNTLPALTRYIYSNHLQSASLELDENAEIISYEEYHPYGTSSYQAKSATINTVAKRYRYTSKERDEESGLYYHGARYYVPWLCRWTAVDPLESERAGLSPYDYCSNNPVNRVDPDGMKDGDPPQKKEVIAKVSGVSSLSNEQMVDALKLARNEVSERLDKKMKFEVGAQGSIKALGTDITAYAKAHHLSAQQTLDFHRSANQYYIGLATVATNSVKEFQQLNRAVINNDHLSNYQKLDISMHKMINSYVNLWAFMKIAADVAVMPAVEALLPQVGKGPGKPQITTATRQRIVSKGYEIVPTNMKYDPGAHALAEEIGGQAQVAFKKAPNVEYDVISNYYIGQHKPSLSNTGKGFRDQARRTFLDAKATQRGVYYRFDAKPGDNVIKKLNEYSNRYNVPLIIKY